MKKNLTKIFTSLAVATILVVGVSYVSAWTAPTVQPPATGKVKSPSNDTAKPVFASINESVFDQIKTGGIIINEANDKGRFVSPLAFFKKALLPDSDTSVYVGGAGSADPNFTTQFPTDRSVPLYVNTTGRSNDAVKILADRNAQCPVAGTEIITDSSAFQFWNTTNTKNADVLAKGIKLSGGNPAKGKILISVDSDGNAVWATPRLASNGTDIVFDTAVSPVGSCTTPVTPPTTCTDTTATNYGQTGACTYPTDLCPNITDNQATIPSGMIKDTNGNCVAQTPSCPTGQEWNATQNACICSSGTREGQLPDTFQTTGKIITYENSVNQNPGGSGAPLVPYYVVLDELRHNGGPGDACKIVAWDAACPAFDLDTMEDSTGNPLSSFTIDGTTYQTAGGNSWEIDHTVGDQCIANSMAQAGGSTPLIMMNIER